MDLILALKPDFAVLDLNMPKLAGLEVIRRVRQAKSETKLDRALHQPRRECNS